MLIHPISLSNASFGQKENPKKRNFIVPVAAAGAAAGAGYAYMNKIKPDFNNIDATVETVTKKIPLTSEQSTEMLNLQENIKKVRDNMNSRYNAIGITETTTEVTPKQILDAIVGNPEKSLNGLDSDIKWKEGEYKDITDSVLKKAKEAEIHEYKAYRDIISKAGKNNIKVSTLKDYYDSVIKSDKNYAYCTDSIKSIISNFNSKRMWMLGVAGAVVGGVIGKMLTPKSDKA